MSLEGHSCWEDCDEGPHGCVCGNDCERPVYWAVRHVDVDGWPRLEEHSSEQSARDDYATCGMNCQLVRADWGESWMVVSW